MIAADTNLVVRHLTHDDARQAAIVERIFGAAEARGEPIFVGQLVLCEVCWTLTSAYGFGKAAIVAALDTLLGDGTFQIRGARPSKRPSLAVGRVGPVSPTTCSGRSPGGKAPA